MSSSASNDTIKANWKAFLAIAVVILSPFQYGLDFGLIGGLQAMKGFLEIFGHEAPNTPIGWNLSPQRQQLISSLMTLGAFISSAFVGVAAKKFGRRQCLWAACALCCVSNVIMMATTSVGALYAGRLCIGLANGYFMTCSQLYIQESSPPQFRGLFITVFQFCTSFGTLIGTIVNWATAHKKGKVAYLIPLGLIYVVPVIISIGLFFIPESPRWLILQGRYEEGHKSLVRLRPDGVDVSIEAEIIRETIEREQELGHGVGMMDMFSNPVDLRRTTLAVCAVTVQAASGSMFIIAYKAYFFAMAKVDDPFAMSNVLSTAGLVAIIINSLIVVRYGRRRVLLMTGLIGCGVLQLIIAIVYQYQPGKPSTGKVIVGLSCIYMMLYNGCIASYAWLSGGEIPSQRLRSHTFGLAAAVGFAMAWLTTFTAPYFINPIALNWGPRYGYIWFPSAIIAAAWVFWFLPEVRNRPLEEVDEMFEARVPARKFRKYQTRSQTAIFDDKLSRKSVEEAVAQNPKAAAEAQITTA